MIRHSEPLGAAIASYDDARRKHRRRDQHAVRCNLGQVENLSQRGMCVVSECVPARDRALPIELHAMDASINLRGRVIWTRRIGQFRVASGIAFESVTGPDARRIDLMARQHQRSKHRTMRQAG